LIASILLVEYPIYKSDHHGVHTSGIVARRMEYRKKNNRFEIEVGEQRINPQQMWNAWALALTAIHFLLYVLHKKKQNIPNSVPKISEGADNQK
jgi:hypothetical protein